MKMIDLIKNAVYCHLYYNNALFDASILLTICRSLLPWQ